MDLIEKKTTNQPAWLPKACFRYLSMVKCSSKRSDLINSQTFHYRWVFLFESCIHTVSYFDKWHPGLEEFHRAQVVNCRLSRLIGLKSLRFLRRPCIPCTRFPFRTHFTHRLSHCGCRLRNKYSFEPGTNLQQFTACYCSHTLLTKKNSQKHRTKLTSFLGAASPVSTSAPNVRPGQNSKKHDYLLQKTHCKKQRCCP